MKRRHYVLVYNRSQHGPGGWERADGAASFMATDSDARARVIRLCDRYDRVCWWTWDTERGRLVQRL